MSFFKFPLFIFLILSFFIFSAEKTESIDCENDYFETTKPKYAETEQERVQRLEKELEQALSQFDECLEDTSNAAGGGGSSSNSSNSSSESVSGLEQSSANTESTESSTIAGEEITQKEDSGSKKDFLPEAANGNEKGKEEKETSRNLRMGSIPKDIPIESDDDIVARQLRQLAMAEKDPVKKEQYWDKYREYKGIKKEKNK